MANVASNEDKEQNLDSALNLWQEGVEKAAQDLEKIVNGSIEQLTRYSEDLEKALDSQLKKIASQTSLMVENNVEDLIEKRDELLEEMAEFERKETDELLRTAQEARERVYALVDSTKQELLLSLFEIMKRLGQQVEDPQKLFSNFAKQNREAMAELASNARDRISTQRSALESALANKSRELDRETDEAVANSKETIEKKLGEYEEGFDEKIARVLKQLDEMLTETTLNATQSAEEGKEVLAACQVENDAFLTQQVEEWKSNVDLLKRNFQEDLERAREESLSAHGRRLTFTVSEAKASINQVAADALARITGNHRMYYGSLKRLQRKYEELVERLFHKLEAVIADERELTSGSSVQFQSSDEIKQKLKSQLKLRGGELVKTYRRQVDQMEGDFARASLTSYERIDSIRLQAVESLEKQVRIIRSELDRVDKTFKTDLSQMSIELPEIEERGRVAAMSVSAYLASMLTLESD